jgi:hypothetical protein
MPDFVRFRTILVKISPFFLWYLLGFSEEKAPKFIDNSLISSALLEA